MKIIENMKVLKTYKKPEMKIADYENSVMLDINTSDYTAPEGDEAAKDRFNDTQWGDNEKNGYGNLW